MFYILHFSIITNENQQNAQMIYIFSVCSTYMFGLCLTIYTQHFNFNFNYQHTTRCLDCEEYIYKQLHFERMHKSLYYLLYNSAL
jgi:hypothetical protein